jgi:hypothetical protein
LKFTIHRQVGGEDLRHMLRRELWSRTPDVVRRTPELTAIVFHSSVSVVRGALARKALAGVAGDDTLPLLVAAEEFSADALEVLRARCTYLISNGDFYWTDQSHERIRTVIGAGPKRPAIWAQPRTTAEAPDEDTEAEEEPGAGV